MTKPFQRLRRFLAELKRRNVYQVAATYAVVGFVLIQVADLTFVRLGLPSWSVILVIVLVAMGFPLALVLAWAFERTPEGMRWTPDADSKQEEVRELGGEVATGYKVLVGLGLVAAVVAGGWYLTGGGGSSISDRSVAVLPFETIGASASSTFTEGIHNDLITRLQRVSELTVIARPSVMRYEETEKPLSQVADELNARWIVTAAVQSSGDQVQVNPRLVNPRNGTERWSDSYRRQLTADSLFAVQGEITREIALALEAEVTFGEQERLAGRPTRDLDAYQLYVQGRQEFARRTHPADEHVQAAISLFRRAIERDSTFALAWSGLADAAAGYPSDLSGLPDSVVAPGVRQEFAARRALELDADLAEAHASLGYIYLENMDGPAARRELRRAIDLKPSYWEAHQWLGELYLLVGRADQALDHLELALRLNPQHAQARHSLYDAYLATGQAEKSLEEARLQQRLGLEQTAAVGGEVRALYHLGRLDEARRLAQKEIARLEEGERWRNILRAYVGVIEAAAGDTAQAKKNLSQLEEPLLRSWVHAALGEVDQTFEALDQLESEAWRGKGVSVPIRYGVQFNLTPLRDDPRYRALIRKANRAWGLKPDGSFPSTTATESDE